MPRIVDYPQGLPGPGDSLVFWNAAQGQTQRAEAASVSAARALTMDFVVNNTATLQPVPAFDISVSSGQLWAYAARLFFNQDTGASPPNGWRWDFSGGGISGSRSNGTYTSTATVVTASITSVNVVVSTSSSTLFQISHGFFSGNGNVRFRFAQNSAHASNSRLLVGSNIIFTRLQ